MGHKPAMSHTQVYAQVTELGTGISNGSCSIFCSRDRDRKRTFWLSIATHSDLDAGSRRESAADVWLSTSLTFHKEAKATATTTRKEPTSKYTSMSLPVWGFPVVGLIVGSMASSTSGVWSGDWGVAARARTARRGVLERRQGRALATRAAIICMTVGKLSKGCQRGL